MAITPTLLATHKKNYQESTNPETVAVTLGSGALMVAVLWRNAAVTTGVTLGATPLARVGGYRNANCVVEWWLLANPPPGGGTISVAWDIQPFAVTILPVQLSEVDTVTPTGGVDDGTAVTPNPMTCFVNALASNSLILMAAIGQAGDQAPYTPSSGLTTLAQGATTKGDNSDLSYWLGSMPVPTGGSLYTLQITPAAGALASQRINGFAVEMLPTAGTPPPPSGRRGGAAILMGL